MNQKHLAAAVGVKQNTVSRWVNGSLTPEHFRVFEIERTLNVPPGALSVHLGYLPVPADRVPCTIVDAIREAPELQDFHREALLSVYRSFVSPA